LTNPSRQTALGGAEREREMNRKNCSRRTARNVLAILTVGALGLAASPAALAKDRGGPGQPGAQKVTASVGLPVLPRKLLSVTWVSWSD
jgi:hypothetical protein